MLNDVLLHQDTELAVHRQHLLIPTPSALDSVATKKGSRDIFNYNFKSIHDISINNVPLEALKENFTTMRFIIYVNELIT